MWESLQTVKHIGIHVKCLPVFLVFCLSACSSELADLPDRELRQRNYHCQMGTNQGVAELQVCENVRRECEKRAKAGHYAC